MTVERSGAEGITLHRGDPDGADAGLIGTYTGRWDGKSISSGKFNWILQGKTSTYEWTAFSYFRAGESYLPVRLDDNPSYNTSFTLLITTNLYRAPMTAMAIEYTHGGGAHVRLIDYLENGGGPVKQGGQEHIFLGGANVMGRRLVAVLFNNGEAFGRAVDIERLKAGRKEEIRLYSAMIADLRELAAQGKDVAAVRSAMLGKLQMYRGDRMGGNPVRTAREQGPYDGMMELLKQSVDGHQGPDAVPGIIAKMETWVRNLQSAEQQVPEITAYLDDKPVAPPPGSALLVHVPSPLDEPAPVPVSATESEKLLISRPAPLYAPLAKASRVQGKVKLELTVTADGTVKDVKVLSGHPLLNSTAVESVMSSKYRPFTVNGKAAAMRTTAEVIFKLGQ